MSGDRMSSQESLQPMEEAWQPHLPWYWALKPRCRWLPSEVKCSRSQFLLLMTGAGRLAPVNLWEHDISRVRGETGAGVTHFPCELGPQFRPRVGRKGGATLAALL